MRACRTDKGVHAAGQVVSVKMLVKTDVVDGLKEGGEDLEAAALLATVPRLNALLPEDIRVFGIMRAANSFHAKERCDSRFYEYLLPTYALAATTPEPYLNALPRPFEDHSRTSKPETIARKRGEDSDDEAERLEGEEDEADGVKPIEWVSKLTEAESRLIREYRIEDGRLERFKEFLLGYRGTRSFHNFTIGKSASDISSRRHIFDVQVGKPFLHEDTEWISVVFHGQSFMLHQIRKMVGLAILAIRLGCDFSLLTRCFEPAKVNIPKAPSLGLLLDKGMFGGYNKKFAGARDAINFDDFEEERRRLKAELIYPKIYAEEAQYNRFMGWLKCNDEHGSEFAFLIPFIPSADSNHRTT